MRLEPREKGRDGDRATCRGGSLLVQGGRLLTPEGFMDNGSVVIGEGRIAYVGPTTDLPMEVSVPGSRRVLRVPEIPVLDATGCVVSPGFLDVHTHGGAGSDVMDATLESLQTIARAHGRHGTTGFLAGSVTAPQEALEDVAAVVGQAQKRSQMSEWSGAQVLGLHLEGPYLNPSKCGAQNPAYMRPPSLLELQRIIDILGSGFRHITLAPELPGSLEVIRWLRAMGVRVAIGHSAADYETTLEAIAAGCDHATHAYNGMPPLHHRDPGILGAVLSNDAVTAEIIADGVHIHPGAMLLAWKAKDTSRTCLVTDSAAAMDMPDGLYNLGDLPVEVKNGVCRLVEGGSLASSVLSLDRAVKNMVEMVGVPLSDALTMATVVPARQLGMAAYKGSLEIGKDGDLCLLGSDLLCQETVLAGMILPR